MKQVKNIKLIEALAAEPYIQEIARNVNSRGDRLLQAWVVHNSERWNPVLIKENSTGIIGYDFNPIGTRGSNEIVGRQKINLPELLAFIISSKPGDRATVRCRTGRGSSPDARKIADFEFEEKLSKLVNTYRSRLSLNDMDDTLSVDDKETYEQSISLGPFTSLSTGFSKDLIAELAQEAKDIESHIDSFEGEDKDVVAKHRVNQGRFRTAMLRYWDMKCCVSGVNDERLLIASHILPWSKSTPHQKGDPANGLLLSVLWDALFDKGLISFHDDGSVIFDKLTDDLIRELKIDSPNYAIDSAKVTDNHRMYLAMHRAQYNFDE